MGGPVLTLSLWRVLDACNRRGFLEEDLEQ
jgi:hypothetical protein